MIKEIKFSEDFQRAFKRLKKRYRSLPEDFKTLMASLIENPLQGSELHDGMRKVRISFASKGRGKRGGGRVFIRLSRFLIVSTIHTPNRPCSNRQK